MNTSNGLDHSTFAKRAARFERELADTQHFNHVGSWRCDVANVAAWSNELSPRSATP
jgi:hypothetical protein